MRLESILEVFQGSHIVHRSESSVINTTVKRRDLIHRVWLALRQTELEKVVGANVDLQWCKGGIIANLVLFLVLLYPDLVIFATALALLDSQLKILGDRV